MADKKLSPEQIEEIKQLKREIEAAGGTFVYSQVAKMYGVSGPTIRRNIEPNENDQKPRSNNPAITSEYQKKFIRRYYLGFNIKNPEDARVVEKLDALSNKQKYIKTLILKDLKKKKER